MPNVNAADTPALIRLTPGLTPFKRESKYVNPAFIAAPAARPSVELPLAPVTNPAKALDTVAIRISFASPPVTAAEIAPTAAPTTAPTAPVIQLKNLPSISMRITGLFPQYANILQAIASLESVLV